MRGGQGTTAHRLRDKKSAKIACLHRSSDEKLHPSRVNTVSNLTGIATVCKATFSHSGSVKQAQVSSNHQVSCVMMNAQSVRSKFDEFECYVALEKPDIICVTETWVSEEVNGDRLKDFELQGYNMFSYCREARQGGGVLVYVNSLYSPIEVNDTSKVKMVESVWVDLKIGKGHGGMLRLGAFYRAGNLLRDSQVEIDDKICDEIRRNFHSRCLVLGDFNLRAYDKLEDNESRVFKQLFEDELFMNQLATEPTRQSSILDFILTDCSDLVSDIRICEGLGNSDHNMVKFNISSERKPKNNLVLVPNFNKADFKSIRKDLAKIDWNSELADLDVDEAWDFFKSRLEQVQGKHVPLRQKRSKARKNPVWLTPEVRAALKVKRNAFKTLKESPHDRNQRDYQIARNAVKKKVRAAKRAKELDLARHCNADSKKFFSFYKFNIEPKNIGPFKVNNELISQDSEIVELLNDKFKSVFTVEDESTLTALHHQSVTEHEISDIGIINDKEVLGYIRKIRPNKSEGPDGIYARLLRECETEVAHPLALIFSKSLAETSIPLDWKRANVVPVYKKGDKGDVENYRPVSLTSLVCKVLEAFIKDKIVEYLDENEIIKETQHGFRKGRSCLTNLLEFLDVATESFDRGKQLDVSYLDFSKAFDKVPHKRLGLQLKNHGIRGNILKWVETWLSGRQQRVILNGTKSGWKEVNSGVPQGSVLGPLLFIIFVNTIDDHVDSKVLKFADDIKIARVIERDHDLEIFQSDLNRLVKWAEDWQMKFNLKKCKIMHIGRAGSRNSYEMDGQKLQRIEKERDLGITINSSLTAADQVTEARRKALKMLGAIYRNVSYKSAEVIKKLYCAYVRPLLEYCIQAWSPTYEKDCWLLERVQKRATKMIPCLGYLEYEDRLRKLNMFSLRYRRLRGDLIEVFKFVNGQQSGYLRGMFEMQPTNRGRGHQFKLILKHSRTRLRQAFFSRRVVGHWNSLPESVVTAESLNIFKTRLDRYFTDRGLVFEYHWA